MEKLTVKTHMLMLAIATSLLFLFSSSALMAMGSASIESDDEDGEEIIIINSDVIHDGGNSRTSSFVPVEASFFHTQGIVRLDFSWPIDGLMVRLTNMTTGAFSSFDVSSGGIIYIPVLLGEGLYHLEFYIETETLYHGYFNNLLTF